MVTIAPLTSGNSSQSESKKPRASKPKVRSGCVTCKQRRIKCDETRPACHRCSKFGRTCGGYLSDKNEEAKPKGSKAEKAILPKSNEIVPSIPVEPTTQLFRNEQDYSYFNLFASQTSKELSGVFEIPIWSTIVLQASYEHEYIRDAIITIGNFSKSGKKALTSSQPNLDFTLETSDLSHPVTERDFALWHYQRFLAGSRRAVTDGAQDTRLTLIVCMLVVCIESLQWHHHQAFVHSWSGMDLLEEWLSSRVDYPRSLPGISSPAPLIIEDEIFQQIRMLDAEGSLLCDPRPREYHERLRLEGSATIHSMPEVFTSVQEARLYLDLILRRTHHFISAVRPNKTGRTVIPSELESPGLRTHFDTLAPFDGLYNGSSETLHRERELYAFDLIRWSAAFTPLYSTSPLDHDFLPFQMLKIRAYVLTIMLYGELGTDEMVFDSFMPEFESIISLSKAFLEHHCTPNFQAEGSFSSNSGLIQPLYLVAAKCRDGRLRREAIRLLGAKPWREGVWWSLGAARVGAWLLGVEEAGMGGVMPVTSEKRVRLLSMDFREVEGERAMSVCAVGGDGEVKVGGWNWSLRMDGMQSDGNIDPMLGGAGLHA